MKLTRPKIQLFIIWALRILVGATFIYSGFSKIIDPWGFIYKIQDYLNAWDLNCKHHKSHLRNRIVIGRILPWGNAIVRCIPQDRTMGYRSDDDVHVASDLLYIN